MVTKPEGGLAIAPCPILAHRIGGAIRCIVQYGLVRANEGIPQPLGQRTSGRGVKLGDPFGWNVIPGCLLNVVYRSSFQVWNVSELRPVASGREATGVRDKGTRDHGLRDH